MRPVRGFERPLLQWTFIGLSVLLIVIVAAGALALKRERAQRESLHAADLEGRLDRQQLEMRLAREQSAREALSLEVARLRGNQGDSAANSAIPTLTLSPVSAPAATPPDPSVEQPASGQLIALRLVLPAGAPAGRRFTVSIRAWSGGQVVWSRANLAAALVEGLPMVIAPITGDLLAAGAYEVSVSDDTPGGQQVATYQVSVR